MIALVHKYRGYVWPYRRPLGLGAFLTVVAVGFSLAQPLPMRYIVDDILQPTVTPPGAGLKLGLAVLVLVATIGMGAVVNYWATRLLSGSGLSIASDLRIAVLDRLQRLSLRYHSQHRVGDLVARVTSDVSYTQDMFVQVLSTLLPSLVLVAGMFTVMMLVDPLFTLLALVVTPPLVFATHRSRTQLRLAARRLRKAEGALASSATESLASVQVIQAFTMERDRLRRFADLSDEALGAGLDSVRLQARFSPLVDLASAASTAVVLWFGATRVLNNRISLGELLMLLTYLGSLYKPVKSLSKLSQVISKGYAAAERISEIMATPADIVDRPGALAMPIRGGVELRNVTFSYGREPVLDNVSFRVAPGESVAIVGPTGAGKSTIAALVPRLADVEQGNVFVGGIDVRDHPLLVLRSQISLVLQDTVLLEGTLRDNIMCARPGVRDRDVRRAARLSLVDEFASRLPDGLDTYVGERGVNLSGGQRQRVAIARAIARDTPIIVLDEPTSALDAASEELIVEALRNLPQGRTRITIAHRLSTVRDADTIIVLQGGRIVETGPHHHLASAGGLYSRLYQFQSGHVRLAAAGS
ncbi:MAG: ABC transporter ATP-binding protein [Acidimicrobiales bacterium]